MPERHHPELVDAAWRYVSDGLDYETNSRGCTGVIHLADCAIVEANETATLRPWSDGDIVWRRCLTCEDEASKHTNEERERDRQAELLRKAREDDPDMSERVKKRVQEKLGKL